MVHTFNELCQLFEAAKRDELKATTLREYRRYFNQFRRHIGDTPLSQLKRGHLLTWGRTFHRVQAIKRLFRWAWDEAELIEQDPFARVKVPPLGQRKRVIEPQLMAKMLRASAPDYRRFLLFMRESMCRPQEAKSVRWEDLRWEGKKTDWAACLLSGRACFALAEYKSRKRRKDPNALRLIPITPRLGLMLLRIARKKRFLSGPVLLRKDGKAWTKEATVQRMKRLRQRLGISKDRAGENISNYTFRHTAATWAAAKGVKDFRLSFMLGHTSVKTTERYLHLDFQDMAECVKELSERPARVLRSKAA